ncbi:helix-turn-helix domain-containing protein [Neisseriaceae bacterium TC5R-5]|nr:helix-turn-helix domain-containing protein [Neisseriaceae bacterium TC5R-5]
MTNNFKTHFLIRLNQLLMLRGIAERERNNWLRSLLEIDLSSANRKLKGGIAFSLEEVVKVARSLNSSTDYLFGLKQTTRLDTLAGHYFQGLGVETTLLSSRLPDKTVMTVLASMPGSLSHTTQLISWLSSCPVQTVTTELAAWQAVDRPGWLLAPAAQAPNQLAQHNVYAYLKLDVVLGAYRIAIVDSREEDTTVMQGLLEQAGYLTATFSNMEHLQMAQEQERYDAFILDWSLGRGETSEPLMQYIREKYGADIPIVLLTGEANESDIERAIDLYSVRYFQKNGLFRPMIAQLKQDLRQQA